MSLSNKILRITVLHLAGFTRIFRKFCVETPNCFRHLDSTEFAKESKGLLMRKGWCFYIIPKGN